MGGTVVVTIGDADGPEGATVGTTTCGLGLSTGGAIGSTGAGVGPPTGAGAMTSIFVAEPCGEMNSSTGGGFFAPPEEVSTGGTVSSSFGNAMLPGEGGANGDSAGHCRICLSTGAGTLGNG